ncbi:MAG: Holliday junction branch migration DNA helicase RuvB [Deltaproteobacteria bacterium]|nr:Holliday junction branch migration DNA helicase RuvB [Deltaproteobacteria bacterium]
MPIERNRPTITADECAAAPDEAHSSALDLRPKNFTEYIGQRQVVETLEIAVTAARQREDVLDHVLLYGPPGLGKTTLAHIISNELGVPLVHTSGPALEKGGDLISILTHLKRGDVLFIDEIHRLPKIVEEFLYSAMEDFAVDIIFDKGMNARSYRAKLEQFTLVGATTRPGLLSAPLRDRFGLQRSLDFYTEQDIERVIVRSAGLMEVTINLAAAAEIARRSRGTPRIANQLLRRVRDFAQVRSDGSITAPLSCDALALEGIDALGLTPLDVRFLDVIIEFYKGGPVGLEAIAATMQEEPDTLIDMVEPFLLKAGLLLRTSSGRKATEQACRHLGKRYFKPQSHQMDMKME